MAIYSLLFARRAALLIAAFVCCASLPRDATAQTLGPPSLHFRVTGTSQRLEMVVNTSRILTMEGRIPRAQVNNPDIIRLQPLSANQVQVAAVKAGVTQINLWNEKEEIFTVDVIVFGDARELEMLLESEFRGSSLRVRPLASSVVISGYVDRPEVVGRIVRMAEDYYPKVINNITVGGVQQVQLKVKVMEVSRTKLRAMGFDWANINGNDFVASSAAGLLTASSVGGLIGGAGGDVARGAGDQIRFGIVSGNNSFFGFLEALRQYDMVKLLSEPTLTTVSGRPASFNVGGEIPIVVSQSLGTVSVQYKQFGTRVDVVPIVLGNGNIRLEVRPQVSEIDASRGATINGTTIPGLRNRWVDTAVEMKAGQTLALAGLIQTRVEAQNRGVPWLADLPWAGAAFRKVTETNNEVELLVLVTPEFVEALDPHEVPPCGPGQFTTSPSDVELYWRGYMEVPKCGPDGSCGNYNGPDRILMPGMQGSMYEEVVPGQPSQTLPPGTGPALQNPGTTAPMGAAWNNGSGGAPVVPGPSAANRYRPQNPPPVYAPAAAAPAAPKVGGPAFMGQMGYDVLN